MDVDHNSRDDSQQSDHGRKTFGDEGNQDAIVMMRECAFKRV